ncbi:hypothetical protein [Flavobacterium sp.]|uniref:hypothetical protein n=1 Tax=Flavobacterium sp. TaxID=239 RepID=UPI002607AEA8|nr:hypothetical protein [Flavobacterium sp.]
MKHLKKNRTIIRFLASMSLVIFVLPFFQMCSDEAIRSKPRLFHSYSEEKTDQEKEVAFKQTKKELTMSGYDLAMSFESVFYGFTAILFIHITLWVCVFRKHYNVLLLSLLNLIIIVISIVALGLMLPGLSQIRYGILLCLINSSLLFYFVYKEKENSVYL